MSTVSASSSITFYPELGFAEANSPQKRWGISSKWTEALCKETLTFLGKVKNLEQMRDRALGALPDKIISNAKNKMEQKGLISTFAILNLFDRVVGICSLDYTKDKSGIEVSCLLHPNFQNKGIATWLLNLLLKEYLPGIGLSEMPIHALIDYEGKSSLKIMKNLDIRGRLAPSWCPQFLFKTTSKEFLEKQAKLSASANS